MSHASWQLTKKTLVQVYIVLIRSVMDYSAILMPVICEILDNRQLMTCFETNELIK